MARPHPTPRDEDGHRLRDDLAALREGLRRTIQRLPQPRTADVMTASPRCCRADDPFSAAARIMRDGDCGAVPIVDEEGRAIGIVTDRDLCLAALAEDAPTGRLADAMSASVVSVAADDPLDVAARAMIEHGVRRVIVTTDNGTVAGIVALADLSRHCHDRGLVAEVLLAVSAPRLL